MISETISVCLPKGDAMAPLAKLLLKLNFPVFDYNSKNRTYRPKVEGLPVRAKIMAEKDAAIQVAVGNYDIGCCGMDWVQEHIVKYASKLHIFKHLGLAKKQLYVCSGASGKIKSIQQLQEKLDFVIIVSEYPNLAENFAINNRFRKFKIFSAWGSVEAYPPEHADVVILSNSNKEKINNMGLHILKCEFESDLCVIVNRKSFMEKNLSSVLQFFSSEKTIDDGN